MANIFLQKNKAKDSVNATSFVSENLSRKEKTLQGSNVIEDFSLLQQYNAERDICGKFRMIFAVNPICSNILFNVRTEIIKNEGGDNVFVISGGTIQDNGYVAKNFLNKSQINRLQVIRDTEYSHPLIGNLEYHCGIDIFNNHMLRNNGFVHVNKYNQDTLSESQNIFNTIRDLKRDGNGDFVLAKIDAGEITNETENKKLHVYSTANFLPIQEAFANRVKEKDGWLGFVNQGNIEVPQQDGTTYSVELQLNRPILNKKACDFIDFYPDRTLYSFIPKYNDKRKRPEKNWDYCITYPYAKDTAMIDTVLGGEMSTMAADIIKRKIQTNDGEQEIDRRNTSGVNILYCRSRFKHTLKSGDSIYVYYRNNEDNDKFTKYPVPVKINSVGTYENAERDRYFSIRKDDIPFEVYNNITMGGSVLYYKKISHKSECEYYFRKYKKLKKRNSDGTESELKSEINKAAFGENIYGDRIAQIIFTDDINIEGLHDHLGRPLSEVYLTIIKRNAGHEEWNAKNYSSENVEYSHCFGQNTAGVDFGDWSDAQADYNIRKLHNVDTGVTNSGCNFTFYHLGDAVVSVPSVIDSNITIEKDEFYGDVVEFDPYNFTEVELSNVLFRFNTLQRETIYGTTGESAFFYDKLKYDDYDLDENGNLRGFEVEENYDQFNKTQIVGGETPFLGDIPANVQPEGYFYNPHHKIKVREYSEETTSVFASRYSYQAVSFNFNEAENKTTLKIKFPVRYSFEYGDVLAFYRVPKMYGASGSSEQYLDAATRWGTIVSVSGSSLDLEFEGDAFPSNEAPTVETFSKNYYLYHCEETVPLYAVLDSASQSFVWRSPVYPSEMTKDMELYETPFSNGRFYIEKNIAFFLRRQDPHGTMGLSVPSFKQVEYAAENPNNIFKILGEKVDVSAAYHFINNLDYLCF